MKFRANLLIICSSILILLPLLLPLLEPGTLHEYDMAFHIQRIVAFYRALSEGIVPPTWSTFLSYGFGSPVLIFNWSFPYYLASFALSFGATLIDSYKFVTAFSYVGSFIGMFLFLSVITSPLAALTGSAWYVWAPYRFCINQLRGSIGEQCAMMFWPWVLWTTLLLFRKRYIIGFFVGSLLWALLVLSQQPLFAMIMPLWLVLTVIEYRYTKNWKGVLLSIGAMFFGMGLSSFSWMPIFFERHYLGYGIHENIFLDNFIWLKSLVAHPKLLEWGAPFVHLFYVIGWPLIGIVFITTLSLFKTLRKKIWNRIYSYQMLFLIMGIMAVFLLHSSSTVVWKYVPMLAPVMVYPQRFLALSVFCSSVLVGLIVYTLYKKKLWLISILFILGIIVFDFPFITLNPIQETNLDTLNNPILTTTDVWGEFSPKDIPSDFQQYGNIYAQQPIITVNPPSLIEPTCQQSSVSVSCRILTDGPSTVRFRQFYFPGWSAYADNKPVPVNQLPDGTIDLTLQKASSAVQIVYKGTLLQKVSKILSLGFFIVYIFLYRKILYSHKK